MSRTYKDRPHHVKVNKDGNYRNATHNHEAFGEVREKLHTVKDAEGNIIYDEVPQVEKVRNAIYIVPKWLTKKREVGLGVHSSLRYIEGLTEFTDHVINPLYQEVFDLYHAGRLDEEIEIGTKKVARRVTSLRFAVKDYCTVNEAWDGHWHGDQPCHKGLPDGYFQPGYVGPWDRAVRKAGKSRVRQETRTTGQRMASAHNAGVDLDDLDRENNGMTVDDHRLAW